MVERLVRNEEASGSNPLISTKTKHAFGGVFFVLWISARRTAALSAVRANPMSSSKSVGVVQKREHTQGMFSFLVSHNQVKSNIFGHLNI